MNLPTDHFSHNKVKRAILAVEKTVRHTPCPAAIITPELLTDILHVISSHRFFHVLKFLFITMLLSLLRQSNFLAATVKSFDPFRQLTTSDVNLVEGGLLIAIKWEKNHQSGGSNTVILPDTNHSYLSPVRAYQQMLAGSPNRRSSDPLICFHDGNNMTVSYVRKVWKAALRYLGKDPTRYTLHGLRRGGTTYLASASKSARTELKRARRWTSNAYLRYVDNPRACSIYNAWKRL